MKLPEPLNPNYAGTVVRLKDLYPLDGCDRIQGALVLNCQVIVGMDAKPGDLGLYFPVESALSAPFLAANNLYCKPEYGNVEVKAARGFFERHGRVRCVKFRGHRSEGFFIPISSLSYAIKNFDGLDEGLSFDRLGDEPSLAICRKYVGAKRPGRAFHGERPKAKIADGIVEGQFRFHYDTKQLRRELGSVWPTSILSVSEKWHGTSVVIGNLLIKRQPSLLERILDKIGLVKPVESLPGLVWSSRRVIKGVNKPKENSRHYYR